MDDLYISFILITHITEEGVTMEMPTPHSAVKLAFGLPCVGVFIFQMVKQTGPILPGVLLLLLNGTAIICGVYGMVSGVKTKTNTLIVGGLMGTLFSGVPVLLVIFLLATAHLH